MTTARLIPYTTRRPRTRSVRIEVVPAPSPAQRSVFRKAEKRNTSTHVAFFHARNCLQNSLAGNRSVNKDPPQAFNELQPLSTPPASGPKHPAAGDTGLPEPFKALPDESIEFARTIDVGIDSCQSLGNEAITPPCFGLPARLPLITEGSRVSPTAHDFFV
jgi:hypothetical protein